MQELDRGGASQDEIVEHVLGVADRYGIRVRHDQHDPHAVPSAPVAAAATAAGPSPGAAAATAVSKEPVLSNAAPAAACKAEEGGSATSASEESQSDEGKSGRRREAPPPKTPGAASERKKKTIPAPMIRLADGSHHLALGRIFDPDVVDDQDAPTPSVRGGATVGRLVLSGDKRGGGASRGRGVSLYYECNGLVLDARTWRALAVPPCAFNPRPNAKTVDPLLAEDLYDVIRVDDGTVVTLYCWSHPVDGPTWALASSNGYDVSSLYWIGPLTYAEVFHDLAVRLYPKFGEETGMELERLDDGTTRLKFARLDASRCYTVGFRHHNFHPMAADPERMWQIQSADLTGCAPRVVYSGGLPVIPEQTVLHRDADLAALAAEAAKACGRPEGAPLTLEGLQALGKDAFARAAAFIASGARGPPLGAPAPTALPPELNYGYILRSRDAGRTRENSDILVETPLLARIRKIVYERAPRSVRDDLTADDRLEYNAMRAYLTANERLDFLALYPGWVARFQAFEEFVNNVVHLVIHALRQRAMAPSSREPPMRSATGQVARALLDHICRHENLTAFHKDTESIVRDYVVNPEYAFLFLRAMRSTVSCERTATGLPDRTSSPAAGPQSSDNVPK